MASLAAGNENAQRRVKRHQAQPSVRLNGLLCFFIRNVSIVVGS
ncbi:hypothetical protein DLNHIDIE_02869 [Acidithiobacillus thiooxidans ATCC 19377]|uniref:Uncharacterized protein n=1 Tax=Acidithiobacillus thiooxidans ATCC 19377 TaxID=637390 RepID=A0A543Q179_ACITH|nr:hypothetical protein DLNHIDIE_02869 [Acidithiobacillus thiooxidans ATCC 19377]